MVEGVSEYFGFGFRLGRSGCVYRGYDLNECW